MDAISPKPGDLVLPLTAQTSDPAIPAGLIRDLWSFAKAKDVSLSLDEFSSALAVIGARLNYGLPTGTRPDAVQKAHFLRTLHLEELALATSCAIGREAAWQRFLQLYRVPLTQAAIAITGSVTGGSDLADSLYSDLYGLRELDGHRRCPLASYSGRGSLLGWLRTTLAQRYVDHHRRTHRETPIDAMDIIAPELFIPPVPAELTHLVDTVSRALQELPPQDRFMLCSYFLDRQTLLQIARILNIHEATVSRRLKRLVTDLRKQLLTKLQSAGFSKAAAEKILGNDPRDIEINLRSVLQTSQIPPFPDQVEDQK